MLQTVIAAMQVSRSVLCCRLLLLSMQVSRSVLCCRLLLLSNLLSMQVSMSGQCYAADSYCCQCRSVGQCYVADCYCCQTCFQCRSVCQVSVMLQTVIAVNAGQYVRSVLCCRLLLLSKLFLELLSQRHLLSKRTFLLRIL